MNNSVVGLLVIVIFLILLSAFFSASEISMMSLNRYRLRHLVKNNHKTAARVQKMLSEPEKLLSLVLIGNTLANIIASMLVTMVSEKFLSQTGVLMATGTLALLILIIAEMLPKTLAALYPQKIAFLFAWPLHISQIIFSPIINFTSFLTQSFIKILNIDKDKILKDTLSREELSFVVNETAGTLSNDHKNMLVSLLDLEKAVVEDVMISKTDIIGIDINNPWHEIIEQLQHLPHTRIPLYKDNIDDLIGIIHLRNVLNQHLNAELNLNNLLAIAEPIYYIPKGTKLSDQIINFKKMKQRSAFVVNEYGDLQGLLAIEDILEEIIGEYSTDLHMHTEIIPEKDGSFIIDGGTTLRHIEKILSWRMPKLGPKTISGLIIEYLGYIPSATCCLRIEDYKIEVLKNSDNTIKSVRIIKEKI
jgi:Mg2+/Co2+ transporter CorB